MTETERLILECLSYDPLTGVITWVKPTSSCVMVGDQAGHRDHLGYIHIRVNKTLFSAHRLAWFLTYTCWPEGEIDHKDKNPSNNRLENLRETGREGNNRNTRGYSKSGFKGVYPQNSLRNPWQAQLQIGSKKNCLGSFKTKEEAARAYDRAALKHFGDFAHLNYPMEDYIA